MRDEPEYAPALPADVPAPALEVRPAFPCPPEAAFAPCPLRPAATPPAPREDGAGEEKLLAALPGEEEEEEEGEGEGEPLELPPAPPPGPLISVPPIIAWAPAPGPP